MSLTIADVTVLEQTLFIIFTAGVIAGAICTGILKTILSLVSMHFEHPSRIKTNDGYLYRFKRKYVPLGEKQRLTKQAIEQYRALKNEKKTST